MGLSLFDAALDMVNEMKTFGQGGVDVAEDGPGKGRQRRMCSDESFIYPL